MTGAFPVPASDGVESEVGDWLTDGQWAASDTPVTPPRNRKSSFTVYWGPAAYGHRQQRRPSVNPPAPARRRQTNPSYLPGTVADPNRNRWLPAGDPMKMRIPPVDLWQKLLDQLHLCEGDRTLSTLGTRSE